MSVAASQQIDTLTAALNMFLCPGQVSELRALALGGRRAVCEVFRDVPAMAHRAAELDQAGAKGVYFTPNPLRPDLVGGKAGARKEDVARRHWLLIDVDPTRPANCSSTEDERRSAWAVLDRCRGTLDGTGFNGAVIGDSGNGWHLCYPIDLPADETAQEQIKAILKGLQARCGDERAQVDTSCHDAPRIWKLYGTTARKGQATEERPHRTARLIEGETWNELVGQSNNAALARLLTTWAWIEASRKGRPTGDVLERAKKYAAKEPPAISGQKGHDRCFHVACELIKHFGELGEDQILEAMLAWNQTCQPPWSEQELRHKIKDAACKLIGAQPSTNGAHQSYKKATPVLPVPKVIDPNDVATIADLIRHGAEIRWLWPGWIQVGVLTVLAAEGGTGKTRFCADLLRRIQLGSFWPDGSTISIPAEWRDQRALSLWVLSDNHHDEIVTLAQAFRIEPGIRINASCADPYSGVTLEGPEDLAELEGRIKAIRPLLVIVDTVGNATGLNLSKQEDAKTFYQPLQIIARRHSCAILCLTHLSAGGNVLGRRAKEKVRVLIQMDRPNPDDPKRKLWVSKSNSKYPPPLGVTMGDAGNEYDDKPPQSPIEGLGQPKKDQIREWLQKRLAAGPAKVFEIRQASDALGFSSKQLYQVRDAIAEEVEIEGKKWWRLASTDTPL